MSKPHPTPKALKQNPDPLPKPPELVPKSYMDEKVQALHDHYRRALLGLEEEHKKNDQHKIGRRVMEVIQIALMKESKAWHESSLQMQVQMLSIGCPKDQLPSSIEVGFKASRKLFAMAEECVTWDFDSL